MTANHFYLNPEHKPQSKNPVAGQFKAVTDLDQKEEDFVPAPDEVARRAYFSYVNEGSLPGNHVQHWLAAEAEMIAERDRTRTHWFHNP